MYLQHHGVKGQQWGVRHGPPYPVDKNKGDITIKQGTKFKRLSVYDESVSKGHAYVTYLKNRIREDLGYDQIPVQVEFKGSRQKWEDRER